MTQSHPAGVQSIERTIAIVRAVAQAQDGARLVDVARQLGITKSTAHRILQALVHAGWVEQGKESGRFHLGVELHALGLRRRRATSWWAWASARRRGWPSRWATQSISRSAPGSTRSASRASEGATRSRY